MWQRKKFVTKKEAAGIVPTRRGTFIAAPYLRTEKRLNRGLNQDLVMSVAKEMYAAVGLKGYDRCVSGEMMTRPIPHVSDKPPAADEIQRIYQLYVPDIYDAPTLRPPVQTYQLLSRLGYPYFSRSLMKKQLSDEASIHALTEPGWLAKGFTTANVRLQPEPEDKVRKFQFLSADGDVFEKEVTAEDRMVRVQWNPDEYVAQRTRLVFSYSAPNLTCQVVDSCMNSFILSHPICHHNLYADVPRYRFRRLVVAFDVKHMERTTGLITPLRTKMIGGRYQQLHEEMAASGFCVPSADWTCAYLIADPDPTKVLQLASGHSSVSVSQKEMVLAMYIHWHVTERGASVAEARAWVLAGESPYLHMMNYGDDNMMSSDSKEHLDSVLEFFARYMPIEVDPKLTFLGMTYEDGRMMLRPESYVLKTYLHERAAGGPFRSKPYLGQVLKRQIYEKLGPRSIKDLFRLEEDLLARHGLPWADVLSEAAADAAGVNTKMPVDLRNTLVLGKDYLLPEGTKLELDHYDGRGPEETCRMLPFLTSPDGLLKRVHTSGFQRLTSAEQQTSKACSLASARTIDALLKEGIVSQKDIDGHVSFVDFFKI